MFLDHVGLIYCKIEEFGPVRDKMHNFLIFFKQTKNICGFFRHFSVINNMPPF